ncbi:MAG: hypothetical protein ACE5FA_07330, partial [Dehalococcoidia bacterium]
MPQSRTDRASDKRRLPVMTVVVMSSVAALCWGWSVRDELYITPESGMGYGLGVVGTALMVLLLLYSLRKRLRLMRTWGPIRYWFSIHMLLGLIGPLAILFHSGFRLGSHNSAVALWCVVIVSSSGVIGRLIYPKIHYGLYGRRATLAALERAAAASGGAISGTPVDSPEIHKEIASFDEFARGHNGRFAASAWRFVALPFRARTVRRRCFGALARGATGDAAFDGQAAIVRHIRHI